MELVSSELEELNEEEKCVDPKRIEGRGGRGGSVRSEYNGVAVLGHWTAFALAGVTFLREYVTISLFVSFSIFVFLNWKL